MRLDMAEKENNMVSPTDDAQRKIYVLPKELVERIVTFQRKHGYPSEVEAVRHLLNRALLFSQTPVELMTDVWRYLDDAEDDAKAIENMVKDLLMGHPLVSILSIQKNGYFITLENGDEYKIGKNGGMIELKIGTGEWANWKPPLSEII